MDTNAPLEILLVEDDTEAGTEIQRSLSDLGYTVKYVSTGTNAIETAAEKKPHLAIVAAHLGGDPDGQETARQLSDQGISLLFLAASLRDAKPLLEFKPLGGLVKPLRDGEVEMVLAMARCLMEEREHSNVLSQAMEMVTEGIFLLDANRRIAFANNAALRITQADRMLTGQPLDRYFSLDEGRNEALAEALQQIQAGTQTNEAGVDATLQPPDGKPELKVRAWVALGPCEGLTLRFQLVVRSTAGGTARDEKSPTVADGAAAAQQPIREKAIRAIELRLEAGAGINHYAALFTLSQFDTFWTRYGLSNAENLVDAYAAHLTRTFPNERIYRWSNRTVAVLLDRETTPPDVRMELTSFTTRRVDYYLNTVGRSALVTLSPTWRLIPLNCDPDLVLDTDDIIRRIDQFEREHTRIRYQS